MDDTKSDTARKKMGIPEDIGSIPKDIGNKGARAFRASLDGVKAATTKLHRVGSKATATQADGTDASATPRHAFVESLPDDLKECYLSVLVWLTHVDDDLIDERELCEIQILMTQLRAGAKVRRTVRSGIEVPETLEPEALIACMIELLPDGMSDEELALKCSLIKDAIRLRRATSRRPARERPGVMRLAKLLDLDDKQVAFIEKACEQDERILAGDLSDHQVTRLARDMAAQAAAVGVPVTALYLSGSVVGLSAAGITSGLAALGLGGALGLSAMVTGVGVVVVAGGVTHRTVKWVLSRAERNRMSRRERMLQEVLRMHQQAIANLTQDISWFAKHIEALSEDAAGNRAVIDRLSREMTLLARSNRALTRLRERAGGLERDLDKVDAANS